MVIRTPPGYSLGKDKLPCSNVKIHSYAKPMLLRYYLRPFTSIISHNFTRFVYLDGFSGPGRVSFKIGNTKYEYAGSPLVALNTRVPFTDYVFIEKNEKFARALELRSEKAKTLRTPIVLRGDCNRVIPTLLNSNFAETTGMIWKIPSDYHVFTFLDPKGLELHWETVACVSARRYREIVINFSNGVFRLAKTCRHNNGQYDAVSKFMGYQDDWWRYSGEELLTLYKGNLAQSGTGFRHVESLPVRNSLGMAVYYLIFATNNLTGLEIVRRRIKQLEKLKWREIGSALEIEGGQPSLDGYAEPVKPADQKLTVFTNQKP